MGMTTNHKVNACSVKQRDEFVEKLLRAVPSAIFRRHVTENNMYWSLFPFL